MNLGIFSAAMIAFQPFLLDRAHWDLLGAAGAAQAAARARSSTTSTAASASRGARAGAAGRAPAPALGPQQRRSARCPPDVDRRAARPDDAGRRSRPTDAALDARRGASRRSSAALPLGRLWAWPLRLPGLSALADRRLRRLRAQPHAHLDLAGPGRRAACRGAPRVDRDGAAQVAARRCGPGCACACRSSRELGVALVFVVLAAEVSVANPSVPRALRFERRPEWMVAAVMYPHIFEGWSLFSPEAPLSDETVVVDAVTRDGRHVDPYNEVGSRVAALPVDGVPVRLGHDSFWCDYTLRIPDAGRVPPGAIEWILRYPERTGRPTTTIVSFDAYVSGRTARSRASRDADQHPEAALPALARERDREIPKRWRAFRRWFVEQYMTVDARSLGLGRIVLALILLFDLCAPDPGPHAVLFERRAAPEPHDAVAAAHAVDVLVLLHGCRARTRSRSASCCAGSSTWRCWSAGARG